MKYDISDYRVDSRVALGDDVKVFLRSTNNPEDLRVLDLRGVVGYFDLTCKADPVACIRIDERGGSYDLDLSMRLRRPEIVNYPEVFIFKDPDCVDFVFRAAAKFVDYRPFDSRDNWLGKG